MENGLLKQVKFGENKMYNDYKNNYKNNFNNNYSDDLDSTV